MEHSTNRDKIIQGERIWLRPITEEDTRMVLSWRNAKAVRDNFYYREEITEKEHLKWLHEKVERGLVHQFIVCRKPDGMPIGCVYLQHYEPARRQMESGVFMSGDAPSGQGYASEAVRLLNWDFGFGVLGLHRTVAKVLAYNEASLRVHENAGFSVWQRIHRDVCLEGKWEDTVFLKLENPEFAVPNVRRAVQPGAESAMLPAELVPAVPGSKSITNRALLLAMLAEGKSRLSGVLFSEDSRAFLRCVEELGFETRVEEAEKEVRIRGLGGRIPAREASLNVGSAGTAARFLSAVLGTTEGIWHMDASEQMKRRPMEPLLRTLEDLGCEVSCEAEPWQFPFTLRGHGFAADTVTIDIDESSQFLSALLTASVEAPEGLRIRVTGSHGMAYVRMTRRMMAQFGVQADETDAPEGKTFRIRPGQKVQARDYRIEPDASAAAYFFAMCPLLGLPVFVPGLSFEGLQGDVEFVRILERMGCKASEEDGGIRLLPPEGGTFTGVDADMSACSDQAITLAAIAPFAQGPTVIRGIGHIRHQECDRLAAMETELGRMGIRTQVTEDSITIWPGEPKAARIETYGDHRVAMGFALTGLRADGIVILNPSCCAKTFEDYFVQLEDLFGNCRMP
ncbi:MAG: 3-phosphoshikimate 1-carboxyvinyltransferase [Lachnospiraceae bacterium]|nr:3-phosphoshikimate 1-carboxyvinyltransferase [Lachnospiraceae bacterium]